MSLSILPIIYYTNKLEVQQPSSFLYSFRLFHLHLLFTCCASFPPNPLIIIPVSLSLFLRPSPFSFSNANFLLSSSVSLSLSDLLVSSSCDITGHCSPLGLDTRPRCQATAVKGLSVSVCAACACMCVFMSVYSYVSERCVSDFPRFALYLCMKNDQNRSTSMLYLRSKHVDDWAASPQKKRDVCALR